MAQCLADVLARLVRHAIGAPGADKEKALEGGEVGVVVEWEDTLLWRLDLVPSAPSPLTPYHLSPRQRRKPMTWQLPIRHWKIAELLTDTLHSRQQHSFGEVD